MMKKARVLICDDETGVRESLRLILDETYELFYARNGREALEQAQQLDPDLLIMDIKMPHLSGLDALIPIKRAMPHLKVLIISGYESSDVAVQAIKRGASDYATKPFDKETITDKVETLLRLKGKQPAV